MKIHRLNPHSKKTLLIRFKLKGMWSWWQFSFRLWTKQNSIWFKIERKTVSIDDNIPIHLKGIENILLRVYPNKRASQTSTASSHWQSSEVKCRKRLRTTYNLWYECVDCVSVRARTFGRGTVRRKKNVRLGQIMLG